MSKLLAFLDLFRKGSAVADPAVWKDRGGATIALAGLIGALVQVARLYGYQLPLDEDGVLAVAGGVATVVGLFVTYATSDKVGVLPSKRDADLVEDRPLPPEAP